MPPAGRPAATFARPAGGVEGTSFPPAGWLSAPRPGSWLRWRPAGCGTRSCLAGASAAPALRDRCRRGSGGASHLIEQPDRGSRRLSHLLSQVRERLSIDAAPDRDHKPDATTSVTWRLPGCYPPGLLPISAPGVCGGRCQTEPQPSRQLTRRCPPVPSPGAQAGQPRHGDPARSPFVPVGALERVTPPVRSLHFHS